MNDYLELAAAILGTDPSNHPATEEAMAERWEIYLDRFAEIAGALLRHTYPLPPALDGKRRMYISGRIEEGSGAWVALVRGPAPGFSNCGDHRRSTGGYWK